MQKKLPKCECELEDTIKTHPNEATIKLQNKATLISSYFEPIGIIQLKTHNLQPSKHDRKVPSSCINHTKAEVLMDPGSLASYIHNDFYNSHKISIESTKQMATMANQAVQTLKITRNPDVEKSKYTRNNYAWHYAL